MKKAMQEGLEKISDLLGHKGFTNTISDMEPWLTDWRGRYTGKALAMVSPKTTIELSQIVTICVEHNISIVPQGGNSGMVGGATPDKKGQSILLSMRRMDAISSNASSNIITCEAGVILQNLHDYAETLDKRFPLTLGGKGSATIGGLISTNAGGTQVLRHGKMRALVHGIEAVLPDGSIYDGMSALKKDNRGYDIKQLLIGAEGTIGIVTRAQLKLVPAIIERQAVWIGLKSPSDAYTLLLQMEKDCSDQLEGFELIPHTSLHKVLKYIPRTRHPLNETHDWYVLAEIVQDQLKQKPPRDLAEATLSTALNNDLIQDAALSTSEGQIDNFWKLRDSISEAERHAGPAFQHDISVAVEKMADFIENISPRMLQKFPGCEVIAFGHLGDGNIHYHIKAPINVTKESWLLQETVINNAVYDAVLEYDGSISAEHGIGQSKINQLERVSSKATLFSLRAIKNAFDPLNIMNPGKLVPLASNE